MTALFSGGYRKLWRFEDGQAAIDNLIYTEYPITIYPNPFSGVGEISFTANDAGNKAGPFDEINIMDISGRLIESKILPEASIQQNGEFNYFKFRMNDYPDGLYFVQLTRKAKGKQKVVSSTAKLIVQH